MLFRDDPAGSLYALGLISKEAARVDYLFQIRRADIGEIPRGLAAFEECRSDLVHHLVGTLRRQYGGD
jgi:hypothetical protein